MPDLTIHSTLMEISHWTERFDPGCIVFRTVGYDDLETHDLVSKHRFEIQRDVWYGLGCPKRVVVTISPEPAKQVGIRSS